LLYQFKHDEIYLDGFARLLADYLTIDVILNQLDDVGVVHLLEKGNFIKENLLKHL
jgi:hypothetical protein